MMKKTIAIACLIAASFSEGNAQEWAPVRDKILTPWAEQVTPQNAHREYPRPQLERKNNWQNLNGLWKYKITNEDQKDIPNAWDGDILVPFAVESALSGVAKPVTKDDALWYNNKITIDKKLNKGQVLLHFGAVDWECDIYVNGQHVGNHQGGFDPFSIDISKAIKKGKTQDIAIRVWDPTSDGPQPRGKQINNPHGIWYTPVSGIWQTVWLESVPETHIVSTKQTPDVDNSVLKFSAELSSAKAGDQILVEAYDNSNKIAEAKANAGEETQLKINNPQLWSPDSPKLYDLKVKVLRNGKVIDEASSYFAMRKISVKKDANGIQRMYLNDKFVFHYGPLDQGWWPDGLHTAPSDEALRFDVEKTKEMGFNMIRKHIKVEPARWYRHCDSIGVLVWQDMPSGDDQPVWQNRKYFEGTELQRSAKSEEIYRKEWKEIMDHLYSYPSIVVWVPFNEAWGQFKTVEITEWTKNHDSTRLINSASGGNHFQTGDILDLHNYPGPDMYLYDARRVTVLGEYGGIGLPLEGHLWRANDNWGYIKFKNAGEVTTEYTKYAEMLRKYVKTGFSAVVYTQTTDVEGEVNGFMTYDRKVDKMDFKAVNKINTEVINALN